MISQRSPPSAHRHDHSPAEQPQARADDRRLQSDEPRQLSSPVRRRRTWTRHLVRTAARDARQLQWGLRYVFW